MRRCPKCSAELREDDLHFCDYKPDCIQIKLDVLKVIKWAKATIAKWKTS